MLYVKCSKLPVVLLSELSAVQHGFRAPLGHGVQSMDVELESGAFCVRWNNQIAQSGEDADKSLQISARFETLHHPLAF